MGTSNTSSSLLSAEDGQAVFNDDCDSLPGNAGCACGRRGDLSTQSIPAHCPKNLQREMMLRTGFDAFTVSAMYSRFRMLAPSGFMTYRVFKVSMGMLRLLDDEFIIVRLFNAFDLRGDNVLDFIEWTVSLGIMMKGQEDERMELSFRILMGKSKLSLQRRRSPPPCSKLHGPFWEDMYGAVNEDSSECQSPAAAAAQRSRRIWSALYANPRHAYHHLSPMTPSESRDGTPAMSQLRSSGAMEERYYSPLEPCDKHAAQNKSRCWVTYLLVADPDDGLTLSDFKFIVRSLENTRLQITTDELIATHTDQAIAEIFLRASNPFAEAHDPNTPSKLHLLTLAKFKSAVRSLPEFLESLGVPSVYQEDAARVAKTQPSNPELRLHSDPGKEANEYLRFLETAMSVKSDLQLFLSMIGSMHGDLIIKDRASSLRGVPRIGNVVYDDEDTSTSMYADAEELANSLLSTNGVLQLHGLQSPPSGLSIPRFKHARRVARPITTLAGKGRHQHRGGGSHAFSRASRGPQEKGPPTPPEHNPPSGPDEIADLPMTIARQPDGEGGQPSCGGGNNGVDNESEDLSVESALPASSRKQPDSPRRASQEEAQVERRSIQVSSHARSSGPRGSVAILVDDDVSALATSLLLWIDRLLAANAVSPIGAENDTNHGLVGGVYGTKQKMFVNAANFSLAKALRRRVRPRALFSGPQKAVSVHFGHESWNTVLNMMVGIRMAAHRANAEPCHPVGSYDFLVRETFCVLPRVSNVLDKLRTFRYTAVRFIDYAPRVFRELREIDGVRAQEYLESVGPDQLLSNMVLGNLSALSELCTEGKSGALFYYTNDGRFLVKTMTHASAKLLRTLLDKYHAHIIANPDSLLVRFYGFHAMRWKTTVDYKVRKIYFVVMRNVFHTSVVIHRRYDLKGSWVGRSTVKQVAKLPPAAQQNLIAKSGSKQSQTTQITGTDFVARVDHSPMPTRFDPAPPTEGWDPTIALKDSDMRRLQDTIDLPTATRARILGILERDADWLRANSLIDYSLLIGVHVVGLPDDYVISPVQTARGAAASATHLRTHLDGTEPLISSCARFVYFCGIVDILTVYNKTKRVEHVCKTIFNHTRDGISCVKPAKYKSRLLHFLSETVFPP